jgi:hypothetical protein
MKKALTVLIAGLTLLCMTGFSPGKLDHHRHSEEPLYFLFGIFAK